MEIRAALARRRRDGGLLTASYQRILRDLAADWPQFFLLVANCQLVRDAGDVAERYRLRAYDALHLASALTFQMKLQEPVTFACWDTTLSNAAAAAKLGILSSG